MALVDIIQRAIIADMKRQGVMDVDAITHLNITQIARAVAEAIEEEPDHNPTTAAERMAAAARED